MYVCMCTLQGVKRKTIVVPGYGYAHDTEDHHHHHQIFTPVKVVHRTVCVYYLCTHLLEYTHESYTSIPYYTQQVCTQSVQTCGPFTELSR